VWLYDNRFVHLQELISELQIPCYTVNAGRQPSVVKFSVEKYLLPYTGNRDGLLTKCTPVNADIAKKLLDNGFYTLSPFKKWCPVKVRMFYILAQLLAIFISSLFSS
jgi:hypothetical protein